MAGLLDFNLDDPQQAGMMALAQGLLSAGAPQTRRVGFGEALASGMGNMMQARQQAKGLQQQNAANDLAMKIKQFQLGGMQQEAAARQAQQEFQAKLPEIIRQYGNDYQGMIRDYPAAAEYVKQVAEARNLGLDKVARVEDVAGVNGEKMRQMYDGFGRPISQAIKGYVTPQLVDLGDYKRFVTPSSGQEFKVGMSPTQRDSSNQGWAGINLQKEKFNFDKQNRFAPDRKPMTALQESKYRDQLAGDYKALDAAISTMADVSRSSKNLLDNTKGVSGITGIQSYFPSVPNSQAAKADVSLQNLKGKITQLGKVAASSSGAIGAIANQEWKIMSDMIAAIDPAKGDEPMKEQIKELNMYAEGATRRMADAYDKQYSADFESYPQFKTPSLVDVSKVPNDAINMLKMNPKLKDAFDEKYGAGAASRILGK